MTRIYLITGFLGAGKTSFLRRFAPLFPDKRIALIINEFGANAVDGHLLRDIDASLREIDNGSIFCSCRADQFESAIIDIIEERKPDYIFVEASGLADPTMVRSIFSQPIYKDLVYAGAICLVDAARFHKVYASSRVSRMQLAISDLVLINKTDIASKEQIEDIYSIILAQKPGRPVFETVQGAFEREWLDKIDMQDLSGGNAEENLFHVNDITTAKMTVEVDGFTPGRLEAFLKMFADETYRIKGFVRMQEQNYLVDCVGPLVAVSSWEGSVSDIGKLAVLYGRGLKPKKALVETFSWFEDCRIEIVG